MSKAISEKTEPRLTLGEFRVGAKFNPSNDELVDRIKRQAADFIDTLQEIDTGTHLSPHVMGERCRLMALASTSIEEAAMWAVKSATKQ